MSKYSNAYCSFCKKSFKNVGPLVEGPGEVYICGECVGLTQSIILQEKFRHSNDSEDYFQERIDRLAKAVEMDAHTIDPRLCQLLAKAAETKQAALFTSTCGLFESTALLSIVDGLLERVKAKGLNVEELGLLDEVAPKVAQLKAAVNARADKELEKLN